MKQMIAENKTTVTKKLFLEGSSALQSKSTKKIMLALILILAVVSGGLGVWTVWRGESLFSIFSEFFFILILILWMFLYMPRNRNASKYKLMTRNLNGPMIRTTQFFSDHLQVTTEAGKKLSIAYKDIKDWRETKHLWVIISKNKQGIMLKKDGFSQGNIDAVQEAASKYQS